MSWQKEIVLMYSRAEGKSERQRRLVETALDEGKTVLDLSTGEIRGASTAKEVTPACQHYWVVQGDGYGKTVCDRCGSSHPTDETERELLALMDPSDFSPEITRD